MRFLQLLGNMAIALEYSLVITIAALFSTAILKNLELSTFLANSLFIQGYLYLGLRWIRNQTN